MSFNTTVLNGLPVTVDYSWDSGDWGVGLPEGLEEWRITHIGGRPVRDPKWLYSKLERTSGAVDALEQECCDDLAATRVEYAYDDGDDGDD